MSKCRSAEKEESRELVSSSKNTQKRQRAKVDRCRCSALLVSEHAGAAAGHTASFASLSKKHCRSRKEKAKLVHPESRAAQSAAHVAASRVRTTVLTVT